MRSWPRALATSARQVVIALRDALLDRDELIGEQITDVLAGAGGETRAPAKRRTRAKAPRA